MPSICLSQFRINRNSLKISFANQFQTKVLTRVAELVDLPEAGRRDGPAYRQTGSKSSFRKKV
jgi:hypothetical protein